MVVSHRDAGSQVSLIPYPATRGTALDVTYRSSLGEDGSGYDLIAFKRAEESRAANERAHRGSPLTWEKILPTVP